MKVTDLQGFVASPIGLRKGVMVSNQEYRRPNRDRKVQFPNKRQNEKDRRPKRVVANNATPGFDVAFDEEDVFMVANNEDFFTAEELERFEAIDAAKEAVAKAERKMEAYEKAQDNFLVLDCELYFPEDDEQEE